MTQTFKDPRRQALEVSLSTFVQVFVEQMQAQGYATASVKLSTRLVTDFAVWLDQRGIESQSLSEKHVADYLNVRWLHRRRRRGDAFTLHTFGRLVAPDEYKASCEQEATIAPALRVRQDFEQYLLRERGLAAASIRLYGDSVGRFLENAFSDAEVRLDQLTASDVIRFVQAEAARLHHPKRAQIMTTALRSFLQYGRYRGDIVANLHAWNSQDDFAYPGAKPPRQLSPTKCRRSS
jgi:integrase/recombinase XerD